MHRLLIIPCLAAAMVCARGVARADTPKAGPSAGSSRAPDRADQLFEDGAIAFDAGRYTEAQTKLEQAWALKKTYDIAGNLGIVEVRLSMYPRAAEHLSWALQHFPPTETVKARQGYEQELEKARAQTGVLQIRVSIDGADVTVNGRSMGAAPLADNVFVAPGTVKVVARREGYITGEQTVTVAKGEAREVSLSLTPTGGKPARRNLVPGVVLGSVAGASLVAGVVLLVEGAAKRTDSFNLLHAIQSAHRTCVAGNATYDTRCSQLNDIAHRSDTFHDAGVAVTVVAGAAAVGAAAYFLWPASTTPSKPSALRVAPTVSPTTAGMVVSGSF